MWRWLLFLDLGCSLSYSEFLITSAVSYAISRACWLWNGRRFPLVPPFRQLFLHSSPLHLSPVGDRLEEAPGLAWHTHFPGVTLWDTSARLGWGVGGCQWWIGKWESVQILTMSCTHWWGHVAHEVGDRSRGLEEQSAGLTKQQPAQPP